MTSEEIARLTEAYLESGGEITRCPGFGDGVPLPDNLTASQLDWKDTAARWRRRTARQRRRIAYAQHESRTKNKKLLGEDHPLPKR